MCVCVCLCVSERERESLLNFSQVILLADILPSFTMKLIAPYVMNFIPYWLVIKNLSILHSTNSIQHYLVFQDSNSRDCWIFFDQFCSGGDWEKDQCGNLWGGLCQFILRIW